MQSRCGRCNRAGCLRINRLVTFIVVCERAAIYSRDVRWKRNFSKRVEHVENVFCSIKMKLAMAFIVYSDDRGFDVADCRLPIADLKFEPPHVGCCWIRLLRRVCYCQVRWG